MITVVPAFAFFKIHAMLRAELLYLLCCKTDIFRQLYRIKNRIFPKQIELGLYLVPDNREYAGEIGQPDCGLQCRIFE